MKPLQVALGLLFIISASWNKGLKSESKGENDLIIELRINDLLTQMTIEEKVGQLDIYSGSYFLSNSVFAGSDFYLHPVCPKD